MKFLESYFKKIILPVTCPHFNLEFAAVQWKNCCENFRKIHSKTLMGGFLLIETGKHLVYPVCIYLFKVSNRNTIILCEICSQFKIKTPERHQWSRSGIFIVNLFYTSGNFEKFAGELIFKTFPRTYFL